MKKQMWSVEIDVYQNGKMLNLEECDVILSQAIDQFLFGLHSDMQASEMKDVQSLISKNLAQGENMSEYKDLRKRFIPQFQRWLRGKQELGLNLVVTHDQPIKKKSSTLSM